MIELKPCECGCKGWISKPIGGKCIWICNNFTVYGDTHPCNEWFSIHCGHGLASPRIASRSSWSSIIKVVTTLGRMMLREELLKLEQVADELDMKLTFE